MPSWIGVLATALFVLAAAAAVAWAALNPASAYASQVAIVGAASAVGAVGAAVMKAMPRSADTSMNIESSYGDYLTSLEGPATPGVGGTTGPTAQTLIVDRAEFRSDNLSSVDYNSIIRT